MAMQCPAFSGPGTEGKFAQTRHDHYRAEWIGRDHPDRLSLQNYIAAVFLKNYGAQVHTFCDMLIGCRDTDGNWIAALGYSLARNGQTFLEQYLDAPLENAIAAHVRTPVCRQHIVEVGNLAASQVGAARVLIVGMTRYLREQGLIWVSFTATPALLNSFTRLRLKPHVLCVADPARLADGGKSWGTYYATRPSVMFGDIRSGYAELV